MLIICLITQSGAIARHLFCTPSGVPNYAALSYDPTEFGTKVVATYVGTGEHIDQSTYKFRYKFYNRIATSKKKLRLLLCY